MFLLLRPRSWSSSSAAATAVPLRRRVSAKQRQLMSMRLINSSAATDDDRRGLATRNRGSSRHKSNGLDATIFVSSYVVELHSLNSLSVGWQKISMTRQ